MSKILFPTDLSEFANNAFLYALKMANFLKSEIVVLHVYDIPALNLEGNAAFAPEIYKTIELNSFESFRETIASLRDIAKKHNLEHINLSHALQQGSLIQSINKVVALEKINLIVMGTSGADWTERIMGSNTIAVMNAVPVKLLTIPNHCTFKKIQTIGFTTKFRDKDKRALDEVSKIAKKIGANVKCLYVKNKSSDVSEETIDKWREKYAKKNVQFVVVPHDDVKESIFDFLHFNHIDLLAMLSYKSSFLSDVFIKRNLTKDVVSAINIPLLAIKELK